MNAPTFTPSPRLFPFLSRWHNASVGRIHYIDEGEGRPLLLLHGNPTWSFLYRTIILALRDRFRCVAIDYPGFGLSERPAGYRYTPGEHAAAVREVVDALSLNDMVVMGQDWGGPIGMSIAADDPDGVAGLVMGNTWCWPTDRFTNRAFSRIMSSPPLRRAILHRNFFVERLIPAGTGRRLTQEEMEHYRAVQPAPELRLGVAEFPRQLVAAGSWLELLNERVRTRLTGKPLLLVWGMRDVAFAPKPFIPRWRSMFADATLVELPAAKHFIQEDAPGDIAVAIARRFA